MALSLSQVPFGTLSKAMEEKFSSRLEAEVNYLAEGLHKPHRLKQAKKVCDKDRQTTTEI